MNKFSRIFFIESEIYDCNKQKVQVDENGKSLIEIEPGVVKRFVFEKLLGYLQNHSAEGRKKLNYYKKKGNVGEHRRRPVIVTTPTGEVIPFPSCSEAAKTLKICRTNIPHVLSGKYSQINGYKIKYA